MIDNAGMVNNAPTPLDDILKKLREQLKTSLILKKQGLKDQQEIEEYKEERMAMLEDVVDGLVANLGKAGLLDDTTKALVAAWDEFLRSDEA